jgi:hypothetical protein
VRAAAGSALSVGVGCLFVSPALFLARTIAAPEVVDGLPHDKGVDWWGLGILLWEFLTGERMCRCR